MRFVLDDAAWSPAELSKQDLEESLDSLTDRLQVIRERSEGVSLYDGIWDIALVGPDTLTSLLYDAANPRNLHRDVRRRLSRQIDQISNHTFGDKSLPEFTAMIAGKPLLAPSAVYAWKNIEHNKNIACVTPRSSGRIGALPVSLTEGPLLDVHYVNNNSSHLSFFRSLISAENADGTTFAQFAKSAFPALHFAENAWRGLRDLSRPFRERREEITHHLSVLNDHGARIFALQEHRHIEKEFHALGISISTETKETIDDNYYCSFRKMEYASEILVFDWHTKIEPHIDRIHIHPGTKSSEGRVIIGIFTRHLPLPGD
ncbi:hypothetical protein [Corallococcus carmarthensis]|uniref:hypothetical protein n=1 Tax=Corallococcus carmarthensis TaxID=2316728 RepID=UPI0013156D2D|nr:hypothetical protein [Corallococcus carmarthensis]